MKFKMDLNIIPQWFIKCLCSYFTLLFCSLLFCYLPLPTWNLGPMILFSSLLSHVNFLMLSPKLHLVTLHCPDVFVYSILYSQICVFGVRNYRGERKCGVFGVLVWVISLNMIFLASYHLPANFKIPFLFILESCSIVHIKYTVIIYSSVGEY